jgi:hypothetical protein
MAWCILNGEFIFDTVRLVILSKVAVECDPYPVLNPDQIRDLIFAGHCKTVTGT